MKAISIRNVPDHIYAGLQNMAKANHRSLQEQIKVILEQEVNLSNRSFLAGASKWRKRLQGRNFSDTVVTIQKDRQR
jgi:plasmid stability protein